MPIWFTVRTKCGPLEEGMANDPRILAARTTCTRSKDITLKDESPRLEGV